jgi:phospholipid/cholesterol/gamma-HCH transport system substrate-binding protein
MAIRRSDKIKAVLFILVTTVLLTTLIISLVGTQWLQKKDRYYIEFKEPIRGLNVGSIVRYHGVQVGKVRKIIFDMHTTITVSRVTIEVMQNTPIKTDSKAVLEIDSLIVGNRFIQITPGSADAALLPPNSPERKYLIPSEPSGLEKTAGKIEVLLAEMGPMMNNIRQMFSSENAQSISSILVQVDTLIAQEEVSDKIGPLLDNLGDIFSEENANTVSSILAQVDVMIASNSTNVANTLEDFRATLSNINKSFEVANAMMIQNQRNIAVTLKNLRDTTESMQELIEKLNRQPSLLIRGSRNKEEDWSNE